MSTAADFKIVTDRLQRSSSPISPSSGPGDLVSSAGSGDIDIAGVVVDGGTWRVHLEDVAMVWVAERGVFWFPAGG